MSDRFGTSLLRILAILTFAIRCELVAAADNELLKAARLNDLAAAKAALEKDPKAVQSRDENQCTPLHEAARYADAQFVTYLLSNESEVNARCYNQFTPLHLTDDLVIAKVLLKAGADLKARDSSGETPFHRAVSDRNLELVDFYLAHGEKLEFEQLVELGRTKEVAAVLKEKPWLAKPPRTCLHTAARSGNLELVRLLLQHGADPNHSIDFSNAPGVYTAFSGAVLFDHYEIASLLAEHGAEMDVAGSKMYRSLFHEVVADHDLRFAKLMLKYGANVNEMPPDFHSMTPLHVAANIGDVEKCKLLLDSGARVNAATADGATPIFFAAVWKHKPVCDLLLARGARLDLWTASALGNLPEVKTFLAADPKLANTPDERLRRPPLLWAAERGEPALVELLIKSGADASVCAPTYSQAGNVVTGPDILGKEGERNGETPLHLAAKRGSLPILRQLISAGAKTDVVDESNRTPLIRSVDAGHLEAVKFLLDQGAKADTPKGQQSPLAAAFDRLEITQLLLEKKPSPESLQAALSNAGGQNATVSKILLLHGAAADLFTACRLGLNDRVAELLNADPRAIDRPQAEYPGDRPLELAIKGGHLTTVKLLIERRAQLESKGEWSMLFCAADSGQVEIAKLLLGRTNVNCKDSTGETPLHAAAKTNHANVVRLLLEHGADLKVADVYGNTPLHNAARGGAPDAAKALISAGASVNPRNKFKETPLHYAAEEGDAVMTTLLLSQKADLNARNRRGQTPLFYAEQPYDSRYRKEKGNRKKVAELIRAEGGAK
ncbi:MAG: ankyrin repeat domain-containing protein [Isosphaeraceae bacterium]